MKSHFLPRSQLRAWRSLGTLGSGTGGWNVWIGRGPFVSPEFPAHPQRFTDHPQRGRGGVALEPEFNFWLYCFVLSLAGSLPKAQFSHSLKTNALPRGAVTQVK